MIHAPAPLIIEKNGFRLTFNEPHERGCVSIECGTGSLSIFLNDDELMALSGASLGAARRIRANRRSNVPAKPHDDPADNPNGSKQ